MDFDFANLDEEVLPLVVTEGRPNHWPAKRSVPNPGPQMTGTMQFMSREVLASVIKQKPIEHAESHDLESFAWVFAYVVSRRLLHDSEDDENSANFSTDDRIAIKMQHDLSSGGLTLETVLMQRDSFHAFALGEHAPTGTVPDAIAEFMTALGLLVRANHVIRELTRPAIAARVPPQPLQTKMTHAVLIALIDVTIQELANDMQIDE